MKCFICKADMTPYMRKRFALKGLEECEYVRCENCGMVVSKTYLAMSDQEKTELNSIYHEQYQGLDENEDDPKWLERLAYQAQAITSLYENNIVENDAHAVDYGCGDGKLVNGINSIKCNGGVLKYDKYMSAYHKKNPQEEYDYLTDLQLANKKFALVINCSVFEHLWGIQDIEEIIGLVDRQSGVFALHTLICDEIPQDPNWFYLLPVHCCFYTNKAMQLLFEKFAFQGCFYHLEARMWFFFYHQEMIAQLKLFMADLPGTWFYADRFVDYWKIKPYR